MSFPSVSVVIPTHNRQERLLQTLDSLCRQTHRASEIIIVDSSDTKVLEDILNTTFPSGHIRVLHSSPSVCAQRNLGIKKAQGEYIFLLDDDISLDSGYIERILAFLKTHPTAIACSGLVMEKDPSGKWQYTFSDLSFLKFLWAHIFQLSVWGDPEEIKGNQLISIPLKWLKSTYKKKGNTFSKAGWPVLTDFSAPWFRSPVYGLGASIIKKEWLEKHPYEELLDQHGIGDNYGVAMHLKEEEGLYVLSDIHAWHYKESSNRLSLVEAYAKRVIALHYFILKEKHVAPKWLAWSLTGNLLSALLTGNLKMASINGSLIKMILRNTNPIRQRHSK